MKANATPELSSKWWKKNKAVTLTKTGISEALRSYEVAREKDDDKLVLKTLSELKKAIANGVQKADPKKHAETIAALKKMPKLIEEQIKLANDRIKRAEDAAKGGGPAPKQKIGKDVIIWKLDVSAEVRKAFDPDWLQSFKGYELALKLNDDILDVLEAESDFTTPAFMVEDAQDIGKAAVDAMVDAAKKIDAASRGKPPAQVDKLREGFEKLVKQVMAAQGKKLEKVPEARWKKFVARYKQYKDYQIKAGLNMTIGTLSVAGAAAGIVGTGGAGLALGIVALVRSTAAVIKQAYDLILDADKVGKDLKKDCDVLEERYKSAAKMVAAETAATTVKSLLGTDAPFVATLPKAQANYDLWDNKVAGVTIAGRKASAGITEALKRCEALEKQIKNAENKEAQKIYQKIVKARKLLDKALNDTSNVMAKVRNFEKNGPALKKVLDALAAKNTDFNKVFEKVFPTVVGLSLGLAGGGVGVTEAKTALETANAALGITNEILGAGKDQLEAWLG